jgi:hypothetical protein
VPLLDVVHAEGEELVAARVGVPLDSEDLEKRRVRYGLSKCSLLKDRASITEIVAARVEVSLDSEDLEKRRVRYGLSKCSLLKDRASVKDSSQLE